MEKVKSVDIFGDTLEDVLKLMKENKTDEAEEDPLSSIFVNNNSIESSGELVT